MWHPAEDQEVTVAMSSSLSIPLSTLFWASVVDPILKPNMAQKVLYDFLHAMIPLWVVCMMLRAGQKLAETSVIYWYYRTMLIRVTCTRASPLPLPLPNGSSLGLYFTLLTLAIQRFDRRAGVCQWSEGRGLHRGRPKRHTGHRQQVLRQLWPSLNSIINDEIL